MSKILHEVLHEFLHEVFEKVLYTILLIKRREKDRPLISLKIFIN